jgi:hypothetical protein
MASPKRLPREIVHTLNPDMEGETDQVVVSTVGCEGRPFSCMVCRLAGYSSYVKLSSHHKAAEKIGKGNH